MKISKWLLIPVLALSCCLSVGCGPGGNTVIEGEQLSEEELKKVEEDYDAQYEDEYSEENYQ